MTTQLKNGTLTSLFIISVYIKNHELTLITPIPNQLQEFIQLYFFSFLNFFLSIVRKWAPLVSKYQLITWITFARNYFTINLLCLCPSMGVILSLLRPRELAIHHHQLPNWTPSLPCSDFDTMCLSFYLWLLTMTSSSPHSAGADLLLLPLLKCPLSQLGWINLIWVIATLQHTCPSQGFLYVPPTLS